MRIVFTPLIMGKPWCGATVYEAPLGGSESAVVYLAREFARKGHEVAVFTHGQPGTYENVKYRPVGELYAGGVPECDVHISSRWVDIVPNSRGKLKILWLHDLPPAPEYNLPGDAVVFLSEFQARAWGFAPGARVKIIGDGVDLSLFSGEEKRDPNRLVWISNPDRGLYIACKIFKEEISPRWPDLHLDVYGRYAVYGWGQMEESWYLPPRPWLGERIILKDPLPRLALARELMRSWAVWYPTYWLETFCMATLEAQAAGTPVISSPIGALTETVKGGILTRDFPNAVSQLRNKSRWNKLSSAGKAFAQEYSWAKIAEQWEGIWSSG